jgi:hypothetical protein
MRAFAMSQISIYLDTKTIELVKETARDAAVPVSRWIAEVVIEKLGERWPPGVAQLAGAWCTAPLTDEARLEAWCADVRRQQDQLVYGGLTRSGG